MQLKLIPHVVIIDLLKALAMGVGEFLSSKAENEWILSERRRENWEMENCKTLCCNAYHITITRCV